MLLVHIAAMVSSHQVSVHLEDFAKMAVKPLLVFEYLIIMFLKLKIAA